MSGILVATTSKEGAYPLRPQGCARGVVLLSSYTTEEINSSWMLLPPDGIWYGYGSAVVPRNVVPSTQTRLYIMCLNINTTNMFTFG